MAAKKFTFKREKVMCDGAPLEPQPVKDTRTALQAVLSMTLAHTAEVFEAFTTAVSEHYGIDRDEMMGVIQEHPAWTGIQLHPVLKDLGYLPAAEPLVSVEPAAPAAEPPAPKPKKKKFIIKPSPPGSVN
jgi:hypothetical protein